MSARSFGLVLVALAAGALALVWLRADGRRETERVDARTVAEGERGIRAVEPRVTEPASAVGTRDEEAEPSATAARGVAAPPSATADELVRCVLYGKLRDADGPLGRAREPYVSLLSSANESRGGGTSEGGDYAFAGLAPGVWTLSWGASGYRSASERLELTADVPIVRRDLTLAKAIVLPVWIVTPDGEPFNVALSARSKLGSQNPVRPVPIATLEAPGETIPVHNAREQRYGVGSYDDYRALAVAAGTGVLELDVDLPVFVSLVAGPRVIATQRVEPGATEVRFLLEPDAFLARQGRVRARFVEAETGAPLSGEMQSEREYSFVRDGVWDAVLAPGKHEFAFAVSGMARLPLHLELEPGQELDLGEIRVPRELTIEGRLLDSEGKPVAGTLELATLDERGVVRYDESFHYGANESGRYQINGLLPARYVVRTAAQGELELAPDGSAPRLWVTGPVPVSTLGGSVTDFDLHLVKAGVLELQNGQALPAGSRCKLVDERGELQRYGGFYPGYTPRFALPPGTYTLVLCAEDWSERSRRAVTLGEGLTTIDVGE